MILSKKCEREKFSPKKRVRATVDEDKMLVIQIAIPARTITPIQNSGNLGSDLIVKRRCGFQIAKTMINITK